MRLLCFRWCSTPKEGILCFWRRRADWHHRHWFPSWANQLLMFLRSQWCSWWWWGQPVDYSWYAMWHFRTIFLFTIWERCHELLLKAWSWLTIAIWSWVAERNRFGPVESTHVCTIRFIYGTVLSFSWIGIEVRFGGRICLLVLLATDTVPLELVILLP